MHPRQLSILGVGLLGGSIGLALRSIAAGCKIVGYGHRQATLSVAMATGVIDEAHTDPCRAVEGSDLIILCTPVGLFEDLLCKIAPRLAPGTIVTDVGSTKRSVVSQASAILPRHAAFVGSHPIAGSEKRGVEFARADLFRNALCILTPTEQTDKEALESVDRFWKILGMRTTHLSPDRHDQLLADISHLPHIVAAALVAMQTNAALELSGKGFLDTTRVAGGDGVLWRDILLDNADNVRDSVSRLVGELASVLALLDQTEGDHLKAWLNDSAQRRDALLQKKLREINPG